MKGVFILKVSEFSDQSYRYAIKYYDYIFYTSSFSGIQILYVQV